MSFFYPLAKLGLPAGPHRVQFALLIQDEKGEQIAQERFPVGLQMPTYRLLQFKTLWAETTPLRPDGLTWDDRNLFVGKRSMKPDLLWRLYQNGRKIYFSPEQTHQNTYDGKDENAPFFTLAPDDALMWCLFDEDTWNADDSIGPIRWPKGDLPPLGSHEIDTLVPGLQQLRLGTTSFRPVFGQLQSIDLGKAPSKAPNPFTPIRISHQLTELATHSAPVELRFIYPDDTTFYGDGPIGMEGKQNWTSVSDGVLRPEVQSGQQVFQHFGPMFRIAPDGRRLPLQVALVMAPDGNQIFWLDTLQFPLPSDASIPPAKLSWQLNNELDTHPGMYLELGYRVPHVWSLSPQTWRVDPLVEFKSNGVIMEMEACPESQHRPQNDFASHMRQGYQCWFLPFHRLAPQQDLSIDIRTELVRSPDSSGLQIYRGSTRLKPVLDSLTLQAVGVTEMKVKRRYRPDDEALAQWILIKDGDTLHRSQWTPLKKGRAKWLPPESMKFWRSDEESFLIKVFLGQHSPQGGIRRRPYPVASFFSIRSSQGKGTLKLKGNESTIRVRMETSEL